MPDGLRVVCAGLDNAPEKIGKHMLEMLAKFRNILILPATYIFVITSICNTNYIANRVTSVYNGTGRQDDFRTAGNNVGEREV